MELYQHSYKHQSGMCYFYENKTTNKTWTEELMFEMKGLEIIGEPAGATKVQIVTKPGESKLVELRAVLFPWNLRAAIKCQIS